MRTQIGASQRVTIPAGTTIAAEAASCTELWLFVPAGNNAADNIRVRFGSTATSTTGVALAKKASGISGFYGPFHVSNLSQLNFIGTQNDVVDILYSC